MKASFFRSDVTPLFSVKYAIFLLPIQARSGGRIRDCHFVEFLRDLDNRMAATRPNAISKPLIISYLRASLLVRRARQLEA